MTINEIAQLAGVSRATVSRYLNNGYVSADKKERIKKVIDETGYKPSTFAQTLRSKKTNYIGVIIPKINSDSIGRMVAGITSVLSNNNYQLLLACTNNNASEELKYLNLFKENQVDGIILLGTVFTKEHIKTLSSYQVPIVILGQSLEGFSCIYSNDYMAAYSLGEKLAKTSNKTGMIFVTKKDKAVGFNRRKGFIDAFKANNKSINQKQIIETAFTLEAGYDACKKLFTDNPDLDTLICATDTIASGAIKYLREIGKKIPEDVQISGFGDSAFSRVSYPSLTTVHFYYEEAGQKASSLLLRKINNKDEEIRDTYELDYSLEIRESTRTN